MKGEERKRILEKKRGKEKKGDLEDCHEL